MQMAESVDLLNFSSMLLRRSLPLDTIYVLFYSAAHYTKSNAFHINVCQQLYQQKVFSAEKFLSYILDLYINRWTAVPLTAIIDSGSLVIA